MPTLADVASRAGVSKATASRALSRAELVAPATVARVLAAAQELGFVRNRAASHLARGRTGIVALVVPTLENTFFTPIIAGAQARAEAADLQLTVAVHPIADEAELAGLTRLATQVDGLVLVAPRGPDALVRAVGALVPTVLVDREIAGMESIVADTASAFGALADHLVGAGHRSVVYLGGPDGSWQDGQRAAAVAAATHGRADLHRLGPFPATFAAGTGAVEDVLASGASAAIPYATSVGLGLVFALRARGIASPGEVLVSAERLVADAIGGDVPAIDVDGEEVGREAMAALVAAMAAAAVASRPGSGSDSDEAVETSQRRLPVALYWPGGGGVRTPVPSSSRSS
ncbi:LacI family DNA-binding transcriptional regulator [Litorihabitans aurantiacus]|uniref:HTH lacI-type domain-containing protein n=1 Tax=Litorihabitans aurantiacus TaxID=1930061 RepID=A0AA37XFG0_9MICO|nr:LacI family DNA-binding transcriptional regulator [Litorihabitans aurantiacus]GMA32047.1 hypothetical protein GCM10025875_20390 [Litorihabitans aurantiacus]